MRSIVVRCLGLQALLSLTLGCAPAHPLPLNDAPAFALAPSRDETGDECGVVTRWDPELCSWVSQTPTLKRAPCQALLDEVADLFSQYYAGCFLLFHTQGYAKRFRAIVAYLDWVVRNGPRDPYEPWAPTTLFRYRDGYLPAAYLSDLPDGLMACATHLTFLHRFRGYGEPDVGAPPLAVFNTSGASAIEAPTAIRFVWTPKQRRFVYETNVKRGADATQEQCVSEEKRTAAWRQHVDAASYEALKLVATEAKSLCP